MWLSSLLSHLWWNSDVYKRQSFRSASFGKIPNRDFATSTLSWCGFVSFATTFPVSYTHLDVYKRQLIASVTPVWALLQPRDYLNSYLLIFMIVGAVIGVFAVSYTHLDVYKRQGLGSCFRSFMDYSYPRPACYQPMAIVHYVNLVWGILC